MSFDQKSERESEIAHLFRLHEAGPAWAAHLWQRVTELDADQSGLFTGMEKALRRRGLVRPLEFADPSDLKPRSRAQKSRTAS